MASTFSKTGRNIICIGRNYIDHAKELGNKVPKEPFYFLKPTSSYLQHGQGKIEIPRGVVAHHEGEQCRVQVVCGLFLLKTLKRSPYLLLRLLL